MQVVYTNPIFPKQEQILKLWSLTRKSEMDKNSLATWEKFPDNLLSGFASQTSSPSLLLKEGKSINESFHSLRIRVYSLKAVNEVHYL